VGIIKNLLGMGGFSPATNALLAEYMYGELSQSEQEVIMQHAIQAFGAGGFPNAPVDVVIDHLNRQTRLVQMNFIAYGFIECNIEPPLKNEFWHKVKNPFRECERVKSGDLEATQHRLKKEHGIDVCLGLMSLEFSVPNTDAYSANEFG